MEIFGHNSISTKILKLPANVCFGFNNPRDNQTTCMDIPARFSVVLKVSKMVKWSRIFVRSILGLPNFLTIPIMNPLARVHDKRNLYILA